MDLRSVADGGDLQVTGNHYVLLLIDVNTHMFSDSFIHEVSQKAGRKDMKERLQDAIKHQTDKLDPSITATCRTVVRGYYDIAALDEQKRERLPQFAAALSATDPYFDFTYVLGEAAVEQKIVDLYAAATNDDNCKCILLAAWGRPSYLPVLQIPNRKASIVEGSSMRPGIQILPLALPIVELPHIFRVGDLGHRVTLPTSSEHFHQYELYRQLYSQKACTAGECGGTHISVQTPATARKSRSNERNQLRLVGPLPSPNTAIQGHVPVNKSGERLDIYFPLPKGALRREFNNRFPPGTKQPCNRHHLSNNCQSRDTCLYDHSNMSENELLYMRFRTVIIPCTNGSNCRDTDCFYGHVCRAEICARAVVEDCPMRAFHQVDPKVAQWVKGVVTCRKLL